MPGSCGRRTVARARSCGGSGGGRPGRSCPGSAEHCADDGGSAVAPPLGPCVERPALQLAVRVGHGLLPGVERVHERTLVHELPGGPVVLGFGYMPGAAAAQTKGAVIGVIAEDPEPGDAVAHYL